MQPENREGTPRGYHQRLPQRRDSPITFEPFKKQDPQQRSLQIPMWHEHLEIKYFLEGSAEINCGPNCFLTQPGDFVIINPYEYHSTRVHDPEKIPVYHMMNIDLEHPAIRSVMTLNPEQHRQEESDCVPYFKNRVSDPSLHCVRLFLLLAEECIRSGEKFTSYQENLLRAFLYSLIRETANQGPARSDASVTLMPAMAYIDLHFQENISIRNLADACLLSESRFSHLFREVTGMTALQYINDLRISKAAVLLGSTDCDIGEIAARTGFRDSAYFSRMFRRSCGCSPSDYRKKHSLQSVDCFFPQSSL